MIIGIQLDDYTSGYFGASILAQEYVNMPEKPPVDMPNGTYGLEEYFELRVTTAKINGVPIKDAFKDRPQHMKGMWDGFVNFTRTFRYFKVKTLPELEKKIMEYHEQNMKDQHNQHNDVKDADWWKDGSKKPWEREQ
jgi:hypothetical protein